MQSSIKAVRRKSLIKKITLDNQNHQNHQNHARSQNPSSESVSPRQRDKLKTTPLTKLPPTPTQVDLKILRSKSSTNKRQRAPTRTSSGQRKCTSGRNQPQADTRRGKLVAV